eukprot:TRINITY_DN9290_c0_g1_i2.p1 TRINITY_DN9290_c0_g1~~TRINITY_DN9290_c0_g1_i2.p1  ORF type:complete len:1033 (-),score=231.83 TRINITY_DN9290_c0_g1_i2:584-3682(-)
MSPNASVAEAADRWQAAMAALEPAGAAAGSGDAAADEDAPAPPKVKPMSKVETVQSTRGVLASLGKLVRWSSGPALNTKPIERGGRKDKEEGTIASSKSTSQLPDATAPPARPAPPALAPRSAAKRRPAAARRSASAQGDSASARGYGGDSERLPAVAPQAPPQRAAPSPRRAGSAAPPTSQARHTGPAEAPTASAADVLSGKCREQLEVQALNKQFLGIVLGHEISEDAATTFLEEKPELNWLCSCIRRCPLPPGWASMASDVPGQTNYFNQDTGEIFPAHPLMEKFAHMGKAMVRWRRDPTTVAEVASTLLTEEQAAKEESVCAQREWNGPHIEPNVGGEYWYNQSTGRSCWGDPGMAADFMARVAERLRGALPANVQAASVVSAQQKQAGEMSSAAAAAAQALAEAQAAVGQDGGASAFESLASKHKIEKPADDAQKSAPQPPQAAESPRPPSVRAALDAASSRGVQDFSGVSSAALAEDAPAAAPLRPATRRQSPAPPLARRMTTGGLGRGGATASSSLRPEDATPRGERQPPSGDDALAAAASLHHACGSLVDNGVNARHDLAERGRRLERVLRDTSSSSRGRCNSRGPAAVNEEEEDGDNMGPGNRILREASAEVRAVPPEKRPDSRQRRRASSTEPLAALETAAAAASSTGPTVKQVRFAEPGSGAIEAEAAPGSELTGSAVGRPLSAPRGGKRRPSTGGGPLLRQGGGLDSTSPAAFVAPSPRHAAAGGQASARRPSKQLGAISEAEVMTFPDTPTAGGMSTPRLSKSLNGTGQLGDTARSMGATGDGVGFVEVFGDTLGSELGAAISEAIVDDVMDCIVAATPELNGEPQVRAAPQPSEAQGEAAADADPVEEVTLQIDSEALPREEDLNLSAEDVAPESPSLLSVRSPRSDASSPPESPSILVVGGKSMDWSSHAPAVSPLKMPTLPALPETPRKTPKREKVERPIRLCAPQPLSARGELRLMEEMLVARGCMSARAPSSRKEPKAPGHETRPVTARSSSSGAGKRPNTARSGRTTFAAGGA